MQPKQPLHALRKNPKASRGRLLFRSEAQAVKDACGMTQKRLVARCAIIAVVRHVPQSIVENMQEIIRQRRMTVQLLKAPVVHLLLVHIHHCCLVDLGGIDKRQRLQQPIAKIDEKIGMILGEQVLVQAH